jgi:hypothetical protein
VDRAEAAADGSRARRCVSVWSACGTRSDSARSSS